VPELTSKNRPRVLNVDDQLSMAETLADGLAELGYEAVALSSSREAAKRLADEPTRNRRSTSGLWRRRIVICTSALGGACFAKTYSIAWIS